VATEKYKYVGGIDAVEFHLDGTNYTVERNHEVEVPAGSLDNHAEFTKVKAPKGGEK
jgi:hypothetical protein